MSLSLITPPQNADGARIYPVSLEQAKLQCRVTWDWENPLFEETLIPAATERMEAATGRCGLNTIWDFTLDGFPCGDLWLPKAPLVSITSITYLDIGAVSRTWASSNYDVDSPAGPFAKAGRLRPKYGVFVYPVTLPGQLNAVTVRFTAGYGTKATDVPAKLRHAMLRDIGAMYEHREDIQSIGRSALVEMPFDSRVRGIYFTHRSHPC